jgi:hypothetical protein
MGIEYPLQKPYNEFVPYPSLPLLTEQLDISIDGTPRLGGGCELSESFGPSTSKHIEGGVPGNLKGE